MSLSDAAAQLARTPLAEEQASRDSQRTASSSTTLSLEQLKARARSLAAIADCLVAAWRAHLAAPPSSAASTAADEGEPTDRGPQAIDLRLAKTLLDLVHASVLAAPPPLTSQSTPQTAQTASTSTMTTRVVPTVLAPTLATALQSRLRASQATQQSQHLAPRRESAPTGAAGHVERLGLRRAIARNASEILYCLSASNWPFVYDRIAAWSASEPALDWLALVERCCLDQNRLADILEGASTLFLCP